MSDHPADKIPAISRVLEDGTLIEAIYDSMKGETMFAVSDAIDGIRVVPDFALPSGDRLIPYSAANNLIASGCVLLPSDIGDFGDKRDMVDDIRRYLRRYVELSPAFEDIAPYYVLLSWVYDTFNELPYLRFRGDYGTGKTRALLTIGSICYKPFFASGASTVSPIFHILDTFGGTLVLDEADFRFSDATAELTKVLNNGNMRGWPVLRTMANRHRELNPRAFNVFGPKLIAMRESFADKALESRFLTEETGGRALRRDIPIYLPDSLRVDALALRNKLLAWRFHARATIAPDTTRLIEGVEPRLNQTVLALLSLIDEPEIRTRVAACLQATDATIKDERASTDDAHVVTAIAEAFHETTRPFVSIADVTERFNRKISESSYVSLSNKSVGSIVRTRLRVKTTKTRGVYVIPQSEQPRIAALAARYGIAAIDRASLATSDSAASECWPAP